MILKKRDSNEILIYQKLDFKTFYDNFFKFYHKIIFLEFYEIDYFGMIKFLFIKNKL